MSRDLHDENYYMSHSKMIPVKWTAPEVRMICVHDTLYSYNIWLRINFLNGNVSSNQDESWLRKNSMKHGTKIHSLIYISIIY